ncbi:MAG: hypothetical protein KF805_13045 [Phycisphaeraceae bacterium]|nr:hypothetical protein [Phycisphaeraceae bacterium]
MGTAPPASKPTPQQITDAIRELVLKLGRIPRRGEFYAQSGFREYTLRNVFPTWTEALHAAGFASRSNDPPRGRDDLLSDWGNVVRKLGRTPLKREYNALALTSWYFLRRRVSRWKAVPSAFREFAKHKPEWNDVITFLDDDKSDESKPSLARHAGLPAPATALLLQSRPEILHLKDELFRSLKQRPRSEYASLAFGDPIDLRRLRNAPVNENGVILLFGMLAAELGLLIEAVQPGFPDCEARYQADDGKWRRLRIEFEYESRNFVLHGHNAECCDAIVCWKHNWEECPLLVVELSKLVNGLKAA